MFIAWLTDLLPSTWQDLCCIVLPLILYLSKYTCFHIKRAAVTSWHCVYACACVWGKRGGFNGQSKTSCTNLPWSVTPPHHLIGREVLGVVIKDTDLKWAFCLLTDYYLLGSCGWDHWAVRTYWSDASLNIAWAMFPGKKKLHRNIKGHV